MKIPKLFVSETGLEEAMERLTSQERRLNRLLVIGEDFLNESKGKSPELKYNLGEKLANNLYYTQKDLEAFSKMLDFPDLLGYEKNFFGYYISALVNKIITEKDRIVLSPSLELDGLGSHLSKGTVVVKNGGNYWVGAWMTGGKLIIEGGVKEYAGSGMEKGKLFIQGNAGFLTGYSALGGKIFIDGSVKDIPLSCKAKIYNKNIKIWPRK